MDVEQNPIPIKPYKNEHWLRSFWRPLMGFTYMLICLCDFIIFPLIAMFLPIIQHKFGIDIGYTVWQPITLLNGGSIHLSFGAILGISAWTRGVYEKPSK